jgi:HUS1 checkpoint protein
VETEVIIMPSDRMSLIREPTSLGVPDVYILLPSVSVLKPSVDRLKSLSKFITLSANMSGHFKLEIDTPVVTGEVSYENLNHPNISKYNSSINFS